MSYLTESLDQTNQANNPEHHWHKPKFQISQLEVSLREIKDSNTKLKLEVAILRNRIKSTDSKDEDLPRKSAHLLANFKTVFSLATLLCSGHGFPNIIRKERRLLRILWTLFVLAAISASGYFIINNIQEYNGNPIVTNILIHHVIELPFPALTLCTDKGNYSILNNLLLCTFSQEECTFGKNYKKLEIFDNKFETTHCIQFNPQNKNSSHQFTSVKYGYLDGLYLEMLLPEYGLFYFLGNNNVLPTYLEMNNALIGGYEYYISLEKVITKNLGEPFSTCQQDIQPSAQSPFFTDPTQASNQYRQINCYQSCLKRNLSLKCNCTIPGQKSHSNNTCNSSNACILSGETRFDYVSECSECPLECQSVVYSHQTERTNYVHSAQDYARAASFNQSLNNFDRRFMRLYIFYGGMKFTEILQLPKITPTSMLSNVGGTMGLFMGMSCLSLLEIFELVLEIGYAVARRINVSVVDESRD